MEEKLTYFINGGFTVVQSCIDKNFQNNDKCIKIKVPVTVETKKATFFRDAEYTTTVGFISVPLLMIRKGNKFFEYFSDTYVGDVQEIHHPFGDVEFYIHNPVINITTTGSSWHNSWSTIIQYPHPYFMQTVTDLTLALKKHGINETRLREKILQAIAESDKSMSAEQQRSYTDHCESDHTNITQKQISKAILRDELAELTKKHEQIAAKQVATQYQEQLQLEQEQIVIKEIQKQYVAETVARFHSAFTKQIREKAQRGDYTSTNAKKKITVEIPFKDFNSYIITEYASGIVHTESRYIRYIKITELGKQILSQLALVLKADDITCDLICSTEFYPHSIHEKKNSYTISRTASISETKISINAKKRGDRPTSKHFVNIRGTILF